MDQRAGEKEEEEEPNSEDSSDQRRKDDADAAGDGDGNHGDSMDPHQRDGGYDYEEAEEITAGVLIKEVEVVEVEVVAGSEEEEASPRPLLAHPCSLLQFLLRACAGCLSLHGCCGDDEDPKPAAAADDDDVPAAAAAAADSPQEEDRQGGGGAKVATEVVTEVWAVRRRPTPPGRPREGPGGDGGNHN